MRASCCWRERTRDGGGGRKSGCETSKSAVTARTSPDWIAPPQKQLSLSSGQQGDELLFSEPVAVCPCWVQLLTSSAPQKNGQARIKHDKIEATKFRTAIHHARKCRKPNRIIGNGPSLSSEAAARCAPNDRMAGCAARRNRRCKSACSSEGWLHKSPYLMSGLSVARSQLSARFHFARRIGSIHLTCSHRRGESRYVQCQEARDDDRSR